MECDQEWGREINDSKRDRIILMDALCYSFQLSMHAFVLEDCKDG